MKLATIPKRRLYPILGFFIAIGAPGGLLLMRALLHDQLTSWDWISNELASRALTYGYVAISTTIMFSGLGAIIGANEDLLHRMSLTDPLTGLPNRRHFDKRVREELARVDRYHYPLTLMVIDLDGLKTLNDRLGHEGGDNALRAVARSLQQTCRATDLAARIGGDEFAVLATNIHLTEAIALAERIRNTVQTEASWLSSELPALTLSVGIADTSCITELHPDRLYSAADRAMYTAKHEGKDRVALAPVLQERLEAEDQKPQSAPP